MSYEVFLYNIPKVTEDGKQVIPVPDGRTQGFPVMEDAKKFAAEHKNQFDRVVLMQQDEQGQKMIERYSDGQHELAENIVRR